MSKEERRFASKMDSIFIGWNVIKNWRPNCLRNEKTGKNMEIDYYVGKYCVGFEYQGGIHFKNIAHFHNDADYSRYHDTMKLGLALERLNGKRKSVSIVEIFEYDLTGNFKNNLSIRVRNTMDYYINIGRPFNARNLAFLLCFIETGFKYKQENLQDGVIPLKYSLLIKEIEREFSKYKNNKPNNRRIATLRNTSLPYSDGFVYPRRESYI